MQRLLLVHIIIATFPLATSFAEEPPCAKTSVTSEAVGHVKGPPFTAIRCPVFHYGITKIENDTTWYWYFCDGYDSCDDVPTEDYDWFRMPDLYADSCGHEACNHSDASAKPTRQLHPPIPRRVPANRELPPGLDTPDFTLLNNLQISAEVRIGTPSSQVRTVHARVMTIAFRKDDPIEQRIFTTVWESEAPDPNTPVARAYRVRDLIRRSDHVHQFRDNKKLQLILSQETLAAIASSDRNAGRK